MGLKITAICLLVAVVGANAAGLLSGLGITPSPSERSLLGGILDKGTNIVGGITDGVKGITGGVIGGVKNATTAGVGAVNGIVTGATDTITSVVDDAKNILTNFNNGSMCTCSGLSCGCCADATLMKVSNKMCVNVGVSLLDLSLKLSADFNDKSLFSTSLSGKNPPPICAPLGPVPAITICVRAYELSLAVNGFRACVQLETAALGKTVGTVALNCFRISGTGTLTAETVETNPGKGYVNLNISSIYPYVPDSMKGPIQLPMGPISLLTGK